MEHLEVEAKEEKKEHKKEEHKKEHKKEVGSEPCRSVSQGVECYSCLPKTAWPPTCYSL